MLLKKTSIGYVRIIVTGQLRSVYILKFRLKSWYILLIFETKGNIPVATTKSMFTAQYNGKNRKKIRNIIIKKTSLLEKTQTHSKLEED